MSDNVMPPSPERMKKRKQFVHVADQGTKIITSSMIIQVCPNALDRVRIGFTVTKKIGHAVLRNRVRRRLREAVRLSPVIRQMNGFDLVVVGRQSTKDRPFVKMCADLTYALNQILRGTASDLTRDKKRDIKSENLIDAIHSALSSSFEPETENEHAE